MKTDRKYPVKTISSKNIGKIRIKLQLHEIEKKLTRCLVHQIIVIGVDVIADGGHYHAVVPSWLKLVEAEAGVVYQNTSTVAIESLQLMVSYLNMLR